MGEANPQGKAFALFQYYQQLRKSPPDVQELHAVGDQCAYVPHR